MKTIKRLLGLLFLLLSTLGLQAKDIVDDNTVEMADYLRESGKIYVVVGSLLLIFAGIIVFLMLLERKMTALEKRMKEAGK